MLIGRVLSAASRRSSAALNFFVDFDFFFFLVSGLHFLDKHENPDT